MKAELIKIHTQHLKNMKAMGFEGLIPYTHSNPLVRWIFWKRLETMLNLVNSGKRVLDFGAGSGIFMPSLSKRFGEVYSLDRNIDSLGYVKRSEALSNVKIVQGADSQLPYKDDVFDIVFAADVLEHFQDSSEIQKEFKRVLRKGGYLVVSGPTENFIYRLARKTMFWHKKPDDHYTEIEDIMEKSAKLFQIEEVKVLPCSFIPGFKVYRAKNV